MKWPFLTGANAKGDSEGDGTPALAGGPAPGGYRVPEGRRVYAIGDVHGRLDLLMGLVKRIKADHRARAPAELDIVLLGDLVDRGPHSAQVIEYLRAARHAGFARFHFLCGNHEEAMLASLAPGALVEETGWLDYGGYETMRSYGADDGTFEHCGAALAGLMRMLVPDSHIDFLEGLADQVLIGDYLFVHAGIRPGVPVERQDARDLRWIRAPFLEDARDHGVIVVHGHTIREAPEVRGNRIGVDTGAYLSGVLTAVGLEGDAAWIVQERGRG